MRYQDSRGKPMTSNKVRVIPEPLKEIDVGKLAEALICLAKDLMEKNAALSQPESEENAGLPCDSELS